MKGHPKRAEQQGQNSQGSWGSQGLKRNMLQENEIDCTVNILEHCERKFTPTGNGHGNRKEFGDILGTNAGKKNQINVKYRTTINSR